MHRSSSFGSPRTAGPIVSSLGVGIGIGVEVGIGREYFLNPDARELVIPNDDTDCDHASDPDIGDASLLTEKFCASRAGCLTAYKKGVTS
jgi:hypothetical protein